jgi:hypothetical protein
MRKSRAEFYWEWCWRSFWGPVGWAQALGFIMFVGAGMWTAFFPQSAASLNPWLWIVPGVVFIATFALGWWLAPYYIYRELENRTLELEGQLTLLSNSAAKTQSEEQKTASLIQQLEEFAVANHKIKTSGDAKRLRAKAGPFLASNCGQLAAHDFQQAIEHMCHPDFDRYVNRAEVQQQWTGNINQQLRSLIESLRR